MKHKNLFYLFVVICIFVLFAGCSDFFGGNITTDIQFKINLNDLQLNSRSTTRANEIAKLSVELISQDKSVLLKQEQNIIDNTTDYFTFKNIKVGTIVKISATIFQEDKELFFGETEWLDVKPSKNLISLELKKIYDESEEPDVPEEPETPSNPETPTEVTLTFDSNGGTSVEAITGIIGENFTVPAAPTKTGYTFAGWEPELPKVFPEEDTTYKAKWTPNTYTVTFNANDGSGEIYSQSFTYDVKQALTEKAFARQDYNFAGWSTTSGDSPVQYNDGEAVKNLTAEPNGNITLYAQWIDKNDYLITYNLNGGDQNSQNPSSYEDSNDEIALYAPTRSGYTFEGWYTDAEFTTKMESISANSTGDITLYAKWEVIQYKISYVLNNGTNSDSNPTNYTVETETITFETPTREGYNFAGWYTDANFGSSIQIIEKGSTGNKTLYAKWEVIQYKISYVLNNGTNSTSNPSTYTVETSTITFEAPTRDGYNFVGWYTDANFGTKIEKIENGSTGDKKLYAKWEEAVSYAEGLTYDSTSDTLYISTAAGLATFRDIVNDDLSENKLVKGHNNSEPKTFYGENDDEFTIEKNLAINGVLENNIDLVNMSWTPIGKDSLDYCYEGVFDGQNHTISNINITSTSTNPVGFFGSVYGGTVKNLVVEGTIDSNYYTGGITGYLNKGTIENCVNKTTITNESMNGTGGIVGYVANNTSSIKNCINIGNVSSSLSTVGGIVGNVANITAGVSSLTINKCINLGEISGTSNVSGILGNAPTTAITISDCMNIGKISATNSSGAAYASGITTPSTSYSVTTSINVGEIYGISTGAITSVPSNASSYTNNYYDSTVNSNVVDSSTSGITGKTTAQLLALTSNELSDQWSFAVERYPLPNIGSSIPGGENGEIWQTFVTAATPDEIPSGGNEPLVGTEVTSFDALKNAINGNDEVIIIKSDITITETLEITRAITIAANSNVTVTDDSEDPEDPGYSYYAFYVNAGGKLTLGGGSGVLTFKQATDKTYTTIGTVASNATVEININNNVKFTENPYYCISFGAGTGAVLNINGGEFVNNSYTPIQINNLNAVCNITGGTIANNSSSANNCAGIYVNKGNLTITGGDITDNTYTSNSSYSGSSIRVPSTSNGSVIVNGETLTANTTYTTNIIGGIPQ